VSALSQHQLQPVERRHARPAHARAGSAIRQRDFMNDRYNLSNEEQREQHQQPQE